jgi:hypothetical protein
MEPINSQTWTEKLDIILKEANSEKAKPSQEPNGKANPNL